MARYFLIEGMAIMPFHAEPIPVSLFSVETDAGTSMHKTLASFSLLLYFAFGSGAAVFANPAPIILHEDCVFAVLAGSSLNNSSATNITGDVGGPGQVGFGTVILTGTNHLNDAVTLAAQSDLLAAYSDGATRPTLATIATELGGTAPGPGVYHAASGTFTLTGLVNLDGGGDSDAVFIFKTDTSFVTAANSIIALSNGAQAKNVFWVVGGSATLGATSVFKGNLLANNAITLGSMVNVSGRILARAAVVLDTDTIQNNISCAGARIETLQLRCNRNAFDPRRESLVLTGQALSASKVDLEIYDLAGHLVRSLISEERPAGFWSIPLGRPHQ